MKKSICSVIAVVLCISLFSCSSSTEKRSNTVSRQKTVNDILNENTDNSVDNSKDTSYDSTIHDTLKSNEETKENIDYNVEVDLTKMNSTMVYAEVYNMMMLPDDYIGKTVRMRGSFTYTKGDGRYYFACLIADATACCAQGIEFVTKEKLKFPDDYPKISDEITVVGTFDTYYEGEYRYCQLTNATME